MGAKVTRRSFGDVGGPKKTASNTKGSGKANVGSLTCSATRSMVSSGHGATHKAPMGNCNYKITKVK